MKSLSERILKNLFILEQKSLLTLSQMDKKVWNKPVFILAFLNIYVFLPFLLIKYIPVGKRLTVLVQLRYST